MNNNDVLRSVRYMLNLSEPKVIELTKLGGMDLKKEDLTSYLLKEDEPGYVECNHRTLAHFLNGLVTFKRGADPTRPPQPIELPVTNNIVLKKMRIAFELKDDDIIEILKEVKFTIFKTELGAFFRAPSHRNYRDCGDQLLRNFLKGLTARVRK